MRAIRTTIISTILFHFLWQGTALANEGWSLGFYGSKLYVGGEDEVVNQGAYINSYLYVVTVGKELYAYKDYLVVEAEGQLGKHFGFQDHFEGNALFVIRWLRFPWDNIIDTSFAVGNGISYATDDPKIEVERLGNTSSFLYYLMVEFAFKMPNEPSWSVFTRIHHRSGIFGLIDDVYGGSNALAIGLRYSF